MGSGRSVGSKIAGDVEERGEAVRVTQGERDGARAAFGVAGDANVVANDRGVEVQRHEAWYVDGEIRLDVPTRAVDAFAVVEEAAVVVGEDQDRCTPLVRGGI